MVIGLPSFVMPMTPEQVKLLDDLIYEYGEKVVAQAYEFSGLTLSMVALSQDALLPKDRAKLYDLASRHLAEFVNTMMSSADSVRLADCAKRMQSVWELWLLDHVDKRRS